jgi:replicative DNA helicase
MAFGDNTARAIANIQQAAYRQAPHNLEAEQALLGAILVNNEASIAFRIF